MNTKIIKKLVVINFFAMLLICVIGVNSKTITCKPSGLSSKQIKTANTIAQIAIDNWDKYGVLPSVAVSQAFIESTLGKHCPNYNLWGIRSGETYYPSLYDGTIGYLEVINNGYYKGAPFTMSYDDQIRLILKGGYCVGDPYYYDNAIWAIEHYEFYKYDETLFKILEERQKRKELEERKKEWNKPYKVVYKENIPDSTVLISNKLVKKGAVCIYNTKERKTMQGIFDVDSHKSINKSKKNVIYTSNKNMEGEKIWLEVREEAKG